MTCTVCGGDAVKARHCDGCLGSGKVTLKGCPQDHVEPDVHEVIEAADMAEASAWPVAGGWLDQTQQFIEALRLIRAEQSAWRTRQHG